MCFLYAVSHIYVYIYGPISHLYRQIQTIPIDMHIYPVSRHCNYVQMRTISPQQWEPGRAEVELAQWGRGFKRRPQDHLFPVPLPLCYWATQSQLLLPLALHRAPGPRPLTNAISESDQPTARTHLDCTEPGEGPFAQHIMGIRIH